MSDLMGQHLGQYEILALLGKGGMASVYRARQISVDRDVAIKVMKSELADSHDFILRFDREAKAIASLSHPFILKVFDYGHEGDLAYLVMELLRGGSLADLIRKGPLPLDKAGRILDQIASALDYAHERGIIHRDLKPQNVLLDEKGNAHLTDFGIAKLLGDTAALTQTGAMMGTPAYMSPEQWQAKPLDARSDIYSLGIMLFEMLTGDLPFHAETPYGLMHLHVNEPPPPLSQARPDLPTSLGKVVKRALAKNPQDRYSSASDVAAAYKEALSEPTVALGSKSDIANQPTLREIPAQAKPPRAASRNLIVGAGALIVLLILISIPVVLATRQQVTPTTTPTTIPVALQATTQAPTVVIPSASPVILPTLTPTFTVIPTITVLPTLTPTFTVIPTDTVLPTLTPTFTLTPMPTSSPTITATSTVAETQTPDYAAIIAGLPVITPNNVPRLEVLHFVYDDDRVSSVSFSPDGAIMAVGVRPSVVQILNVATLEKIRSLEGHSDTVYSVVFSPDGNLLASGSFDRTIRLWDPATGIERATLQDSSMTTVYRLAFSPDGKWLASGGQDAYLRLWDVQAGKVTKAWQIPSQFTSAVAFSPDGKLLAAAGGDQIVRVWDMKTQSQLFTLQGHTGAIYSLTFSPDGKLLASGGGDKTIRLWDVQNKKQIAVLKGHTGTIFALAFSPDGTVLASGGGDHSMRLWDVQKATEILTLVRHTDDVYGVAFSPNGKLIVSVGLDRAIAEWAIPPQ